jgi:precorrin-2/cobalt-factor-2 C20-methyltransferase
MILSCVGCGPGDPELLTVKAVKLIKNAEVIFAPTAKEGRPSIALSVVKSYLNRSTKTISLIFPMIKDKQSLKEYWRKNAKLIADQVRSGKNVLYLTVGDPSLYSTWIYIYRELQENHKDVLVDIVPGVPSMCAFAAEAKISLAEGDENVAIVPACYDLDKVTRTSRVCDNIVFLKDGRYFDSVLNILSDTGFPKDSTIAIAQDVGTQGEVMKMSRLEEFHGKSGPTEKYFSIMVAKKRSDRQ